MSINSILGPDLTARKHGYRSIATLGDPALHPVRPTYVHLVWSGSVLTTADVDWFRRTVKSSRTMMETSALSFLLTQALLSRWHFAQPRLRAAQYRLAVLGSGRVSAVKASLSLRYHRCPWVLGFWLPTQSATTTPLA